MMKREKQKDQKFTSDLHEYTVTQTLSHIHMNTYTEDNKEKVKFLKIGI